MAYESTALPLSYIANSTDIIAAGRLRGKRNTQICLVFGSEIASSHCRGEANVVNSRAVSEIPVTFPSCGIHPRMHRRAIPGKGGIYRCVHMKWQLSCVPIFR